MLGVSGLRLGMIADVDVCHYVNLLQVPFDWRSTAAAHMYLNIACKQWQQQSTA